MSDDAAPIIATTVPLISEATTMGEFEALRARLGIRWAQVQVGLEHPFDALLECEGHRHDGNGRTPAEALNAALSRLLRLRRAQGVLDV